MRHRSMQRITSVIGTCAILYISRIKHLRRLETFACRNSVTITIQKHSKRAQRVHLKGEMLYFVKQTF